MGLHLKVPEYQLSDRGAREHRHRIWWTAYICDRMWASKLGQPASIQDDDVDVDLPSSEGLTGPQARDFGDPDYIIASIKLARLATHIISSIYKRKGQHGAFSQRVQQALRNLRSWVEELPSHLQLDTEESLQTKTKPIVYLHLSFNQVSLYINFRGSILSSNHHSLSYSRRDLFYSTSSALTVNPSEHQQARQRLPSQKPPSPSLRPAFVARAIPTGCSPNHGLTVPSQPLATSTRSTFSRRPPSWPYLA